LKRRPRRDGPRQGQVAPRAGAWIETPARKLGGELVSVAPRAGAWIETLAQRPPHPGRGLSPPARGRGLKLQFNWVSCVSWMLCIPLKVNTESGQAER